jgi:DNA-directed RNA polymerase specialized sigma24 family protein
VTADPAGPPAEATDADVIRLSRTEPERFEEIFRRWFVRIHQYLGGRVGGRIADDLAAEVFARAFAQRERYDLTRDSAGPWLYGIATNLAGTYWRQERSRYWALARSRSAC